MPRDLPLGNGRLLVAFGLDYLVRELTFPHVGDENHAGGTPFRLGVWADGRFSWVPDGWEISRRYLEDTLVTDVALSHRDLGLVIAAQDAVDYDANLLVRRLRVENRTDREREVRLFFCHDLAIGGNDIGDTAAYRPEARGIVHYKGERWFLVNCAANGKSGVDLFATGNRVPGRLEGAWRDAEDGELSGNPVAQGSVDSVVGVRLGLPPRGSATAHLWLCAGSTWEEVRALNAQVARRGPEAFLERTRCYWRLWARKEPLREDLLPPAVARLYTRSLLVARTQINACGSIIAANDSDVVSFNRDTYSYMWLRDAALTAHAFDCAGYPEIATGFFPFCAGIIEKEGYFLHKYTPSGALASSWHPWVQGRKAQLPIQEDETALVLWALWEHFALYRDVEFVKPLYRPLVRAAADMLLSFRDGATKLPLPSYDLWEEKQGIMTYTVATVYGGLTAAARFAEAFGEEELAEEYREGAREVRDAMDRHLYLPDEGRFARTVHLGAEGSVTRVDRTVDASLFALFAFGAYHPGDAKVRSTMAQIRERLWCGSHGGGLARYEGDDYHRATPEVPGNPWFVTTLWLALHHIALAEDRAGLAPALELLEWVAQHALPSGVLAEQVNPLTGAPLSVSPLTWSHATYVTAVCRYLAKLAALDRCAACGQALPPVLPAGA
jgi:GH15 family glucan-1,4-alpha-glucosidase